MRLNKEVIRGSLFYIICTLLFFYPYLGRFTSSLIGSPGDNMQDFWNTAHSEHVFEVGSSPFFYTKDLFFPEGATLRYHSFSYSNLFLIHVIRKVFFLPATPPVLVGLHNTMILFSFFLSALGAFLLAKYLIRNSLGAMVGGFIFAFSPFHIAHGFGHMHVATIQYIPFFVLLFLRWIEEKKIVSFFGSVFFFALAALSCWYYLFYLAYFLLFYNLFQAIRLRSLKIKEILLPSMAVLVAVLVFLSPLLLPMLHEGLGNEDAYARGHDVFVADPVGFFVFHPFHLLGNLTQGINAKLRGNTTEMSVYLGIVNMGLLLWAWFHRKQLSLRHFSFCLWGMLFFSSFALGSHLHILGQKLAWLPLPTFVTESIPFFRNVRTPSRAVVFNYLFLGIAVSEIVKASLVRYSVKQTSWIVVVIFALLILDFYPAVQNSTPVSLPKAYDVVRMDPDHDFGIMDLPKTYEDGNRYMMYQVFHQRPIVHASISRKLTMTLSNVMEMVDLPLQREELIHSRVKYIVFHNHPISTKGRQDVTEYRYCYPVVYEDEDQVVFKVY